MSSIVSTEQKKFLCNKDHRVCVSLALVLKDKLTTFIDQAMEYIKDTLFTHWHFMRWLRLGLGLFMGMQAIQVQDTLAGFIAIFFLYQATTNTGCCGAEGCAVPSSSKTADKSNVVEYEEVKSVEK
jgi:hypothetical protein